MIKEFLKPCRRNVIIMSDKDRPGIDGANKLAKEIRFLTKSVKVVKPPKHKDIREWKANGATAAVVMAIVKNMRYCA